MNVYQGYRNTNQELVVTVNGEVLPRRHDLRNHSPTGFECGYGGSGPAQLALAVLAHHFGDDDSALKLYQSFKWKVIADLPREGWTLTGEEIDEACASLELP